MKKGWVLAGLFLLAFFVGGVLADEVDQLIKQLKSWKSDVRLAAAKELGSRKDPRAVDPLVSVLRSDANWEVRLAAEDSLASIGSSAAEPLVRVLNEEKNCFPRRRTVRTLQKIKDPCATETLKKVSAEDADCCVRRFAAKALGEINDPKAAEFLNDAMKKRNMEIIFGAYRYYVRKGELGTEDIIVEAMQEHSYNKTMIFDLANCGNEKLQKAAEEIAKKMGYAMTPGWSGPKWGKAQLPG
jgi:DNA topoisomerase VI subunit B